MTGDEEAGWVAQPGVCAGAAVGEACPRRGLLRGDRSFAASQYESAVGCVQHAQCVKNSAVGLAVTAVQCIGEPRICVYSTP